MTYHPNFRKTRERPGDWHLHARCRDTDPDLFFPVGWAGLALQQAEDAKTVCRDCPVQKPCLEEALRHNDKGVWGNTTEAERVQIRVRRENEKMRART